MRADQISSEMRDSMRLDGGTYTKEFLHEIKFSLMNECAQGNINKRNLKEIENLAIEIINIVTSSPDKVKKEYGLQY